jgi:hypothetical protein
VALIRTDVSEESIAFIIRVERIRELGTTSALTLMVEIRSSETSVVTKATRRHIPEDRRPYIWNAVICFNEHFAKSAQHCTLRLSPYVALPVSVRPISNPALPIAATLDVASASNRFRNVCHFPALYLSQTYLRRKNERTLAENLQSRRKQHLYPPPTSVLFQIWLL